MKKRLFALGAVSVLALGLASCGEEQTSDVPKEGKAITLEYSGTGSNKEFNLQLFEDFKTARKAAGDPNTYTITYVEHGPDKIDSEVTDWTTGPDVFEFASDKITALYQKGALARVTTSYEKFVRENNSELGVSLSEFNGKIYGYPYTGDNTYYLQYNKSLLTSEQAGSIESILAVCKEKGLKLGYNLQEAFWGAAAMFSFGADYQMTFDVDGSPNNIQADFDSDKGLKAAKAIYSIVKHENWQNSMEAPTPDNNLIGCIAGTWDISSYRTALGDDYACAPMPTVTVDGETVNLGAFLGGKLLGVNPARSSGDSDRLVAAHELAKFLSGKECQLKRFDDQKVAPCNIDAAKESRVVNDENVKVLIEQAKFAHAQTAVPGNFWTAPNTLITGMVDGTVTLTNLAAQLVNFNNQIKTLS